MFRRSFILLPFCSQAEAWGAHFLQTPVPPPAPSGAAARVLAAFCNCPFNLGLPFPSWGIPRDLPPPAPPPWLQIPGRRLVRMSCSLVEPGSALHPWAASPSNFGTSMSLPGSTLRHSCPTLFSTGCSPQIFGVFFPQFFTFFSPCLCLPGHTRPELYPQDTRSSTTTALGMSPMGSCSETGLNGETRKSIPAGLQPWLHQQYRTGNTEGKTTTFYFLLLFPPPNYRKALHA